MKNVLRLVFLICFSLISSAQTIDRFSIDAGGVSTSSGGIEILYTLGEIHVAELAAGNTQISEGFIHSSLADFCFGLALTTWNAGSWSNGFPDTTRNVRFTTNFNTEIQGANIDACSCEIPNGISVTVAAEDYLNVLDDIRVNGDLTIAHTGSVVQVNELARTYNEGSIEVGLTTPELDRRDYLVLGSPMTAETNAVFTGAWRVLEFFPENFIPFDPNDTGGTNFTDDNGDYYEPRNGILFPGEGYLVRPKDPAIPGGGSYSYSFTNGTLSSGTISYSAFNNGPVANPNGTPQVVANPYASAIDANTFFVENPTIDALYFWEHLTPPRADLPGSGGLNFDMGDISIYNTVMGIPAANDLLGTTAPNGVISTGQGFGVRTNGTAGSSQDIIFNNSMRLTSGNTTLRNQSFSEKIVLEVRNEEFGVGSYAGIAFSKTGSASYDDGMESNRLANVVSIYSLIENESNELSIQTREEFNTSIVIPLGFRSQVPANLRYEISLAAAEGDLIENSAVYLYDRVAAKTVNLKEEGSYRFNSDEAILNSRFELLFDTSILDVDSFLTPIISIYPNPAKDEVIINSPQAQLEALYWYDAQGRLVYAEKSLNTLSKAIDVTSMASGVYIVQVKTVDGTSTHRIIKE